MHERLTAAGGKAAVALQAAHAVWQGSGVRESKASLLREAGLPSRCACSGPSTSSSPLVLWRDMPLGLSLHGAPQTRVSGSESARLITTRPCAQHGLRPVAEC